MAEHNVSANEVPPNSVSSVKAAVGLPTGSRRTGADHGAVIAAVVGRRNFRWLM